MTESTKNNESESVIFWNIPKKGISSRDIFLNLTNEE